MCKFIVITGGVISGLGKGIVASSIGLLLKKYSANRANVTALKMDPYLNVDAGTMSPFEHGECYVLDDGGETDLDLGSYERFLNINLTSKHSITLGKVYKIVIENERKGVFLGQTVQINPHVVDQIKQMIIDVPSPSDDICIIELGGTVGENESFPFLEALRQLKMNEEVIFIHVTLVPRVNSNCSELKTKPTQESLKILRGFGIEPDFLCIRCSSPISAINSQLIEKISKMCYINENSIFINADCGSIYDVPKMLMENSPHSMSHLLNILGVEKKVEPDLKLLSLLGKKHDRPVKIAIVGKYTGLNDTYLALVRALQHAGIYQSERGVEIVYINSDVDDLTQITKQLKNVKGIVIPGGFGDRGINGMILAIYYARVNNVPLLGICLGMQLMVIETARTRLGYENASSAEFKDGSEDNWVIPISEIDKEYKGGNMRLGLHGTQILRECDVLPYQKDSIIQERHRHRYEINPQIVDKLSSPDSGCVILGVDAETGKKIDLIQFTDMRFGIGCQFHPEFLSRIGRPGDIFSSFFRACQQF